MLSDNHKWRVFHAKSFPPGRFGEIREELLAGLDAAEVRDLVNLLETGTPNERHAAVGLLSELSRRSDGRLGSAEEQRYQVTVKGIARAEFPLSLPGVGAFQAWRRFDREGAETFITEELPLERIVDGPAALDVIFQLRSFGGPRALKRLESLTELTGRAAEERDAGLRVAQPISEHELQSLARRWRKTKSPELLSQLYSRHITRLPVGTVPIENLVKLLGPPSGRRGHDVWYQPDSGTQLFLEGDTEGHLAGRRFS